MRLVQGLCRQLVLSFQVLQSFTGRICQALPVLLYERVTSKGLLLLQSLAGQVLLLCQLI